MRVEYIVRVSLWALTEVLVNAASDFEAATSQIALYLFVEGYWNLPRGMIIILGFKIII